MQVRQFYHKNQFIITDDDNINITFQSYNSKIAKLDKQKNILTIYTDYNYSQTTLKHFYKFIDDFVYQVNISDSKNKLESIKKLFNQTINGLKIIYQN